MPAIGKNIRLGGLIFVLSFAIFAGSLFGISQILHEKPAAEATTAVGGGGGEAGPPISPGEPVTVDMVAKDISFSTRSIRAGAGVEVTINFDNQDAGVLHNIAFYDTPKAQNAIFTGELVTGVDKITESFTAPSTPGTYFFRCDVHPDQMTGSFIVR